MAELFEQASKRFTEKNISPLLINQDVVPHEVYENKKIVSSNNAHRSDTAWFTNEIIKLQEELKRIKIHAKELERENRVLKEDRQRVICEYQENTALLNGEISALKSNNAQSTDNEVFTAACAARVIELEELLNQTKDELAKVNRDNTGPENELLVQQVLAITAERRVLLEKVDSLTTLCNDQKVQIEAFCKDKLVEDNLNYYEYDDMDENRILGNIISIDEYYPSEVTELVEEEEAARVDHQETRTVGELSPKPGVIIARKHIACPDCVGKPIAKRHVPEVRPASVGILGMEVYFPTTVISQKDLEVYDLVGTGKYTIGLGQQNMGFCGDKEDAISMALTTVSRLLENYGVSYSQIGRLEVGTETILDKSKSIKSSLMQLFQASGNLSVEGIDTYNACYGGTSALLNTVAWVESSSWDGRFGIVVCGDIAVYANGPARPTGGAGSVAMLIGPNAPIVIEPGLRGSHFDHAYDFYKPNLASEYPVVDGKLSLVCYVTALHKCFQNYSQLFTASTNTHLAIERASSNNTNYNNKLMMKKTYVDYMCFHSPYTKLVRKSFARLIYHEHAQAMDLAQSDLAHSNILSPFEKKGFTDNIENRDCELLFMDRSHALFEQMVQPSLLLAENVGNTYTASLYFSLASLIATKGGKELENKRALLFSYGSGLASSMFSVYFTNPDALVYTQLATLPAQLAKRSWRPVAEYVNAMQLREDTHAKAPYTTTSPIHDIQTNAYYLSCIDDKFRRTYYKK